MTKKQLLKRLEKAIDKTIKENLERAKLEERRAMASQVLNYK